MAKDFIQFQARQSRIEDYKVTDIFINYFNLIDELRQFEQYYAEQENIPYLAGNYEGLPPLIASSEHLLGKTYPLYPPFKNKTIIYVSGKSGLYEDWALYVQITIEQTQIVWHNFEQAQRPFESDYYWEYKNWEFIFDKKQYIQAIKALASNAY